MQQVGVPFEVVIGEDCSTDGTRDVVREYAERFPQLVRPLFPERNRGMMANFCATLAACSGSYVAILEGDDYWTDPQKLQRQIEFLDQHPECSGCFHNVRIVHEGSPQQDRDFHDPPLARERLYLCDLVSSHQVPTCSTMFRALSPEPLPSWFQHMPMGDWPLHILNGERGPYAYLPEVMAAYRVHDGGTWSGSSRIKILERTLAGAKLIESHLDGRCSAEIGKSIETWEQELVKNYLQNGDVAGALQRCVHIFRQHPTARYLYKNLKRIARHMLRH
jgi:glycosyltransferase involved in cell wall biosynthesis